MIKYKYMNEYNVELFLCDCFDSKIYMDHFIVKIEDDVIVKQRIYRRRWNKIELDAFIFTKKDVDKLKKIFKDRDDIEVEYEELGGNMMSLLLTIDISKLNIFRKLGILFSGKRYMIVELYEEGISFILQ